jgi:hypothetical protein
VRYLVQRPLPDELLTSALIRTSRRAGLPIGTVAKALANGRKWVPRFFQASQLADLGEHFRIPAFDLLWRHSAFPYSSAFFDEALYRRALATALSTGRVAHGAGPVTQSVSDFVKFRRYCPRCASDDERQWGESYWHREHNLPGVAVCLKHHCALLQTELRTAGTKAWSYALPREVRGKRLVPAKLTPFDLEVAKLSVALLARGPDSHCFRGASWYRTELERGGLVSPGRAIDKAKLVECAVAVGGHRLRQSGLSARDIDLHWLGLMVRPASDLPFPAFKHILFEALLAHFGESATPRLNHSPQGMSARPRGVQDANCSNALRKVILEHIRRGERIRICDALTMAGCWSSFRHGRSLFPRVKAALELLRASSASVRPKADRSKD